MKTIDVINKLNLADEKKLKLLALYVDSLLNLRPILRDADLQDFIDDVFNEEEEEDSGTCCPSGPPGERGEPGIPDDDDVKTRYDELLEPLEDLGSLAATSEDHGPIVKEVDVHLIKIRVSQEHLQKWINIMQAPDDPELPPPGTTISSMLHADAGTAAFAAKLVSAEGGPFIDAYLQKGKDIVCEHKPIRDTAFLESRTNINMQYGEHIYEFEIVSIEEE